MSQSHDFDPALYDDDDDTDTVKPAGRSDSNVETAQPSGGDDDDTDSVKPAGRLEQL